MVKIGDENPYVFTAQNLKLQASLVISGNQHFLSSREQKVFIYAILGQFDNPQVLEVRRDDREALKCITVVMEGSKLGTRIRMANCQFGTGWKFFNLNYSVPATKKDQLDPELSKIFSHMQFKEKGPGQETSYSADMTPLKHLLKPGVLTVSRDFFEAVAQDDVDYGRLESLFKQGADPNWYKDSAAPLLIAAMKNDLKLIRWLCEHGAEADHPMVDSTVVSLSSNPPIPAFIQRRAEAERAKCPDYNKNHPPRKILSPPNQPSQEDLDFEMFFAVEYGYIDKLKEAVGKGANLKAVDSESGLSVKTLLENCISDIQTLGGDPGPYLAISAWLQKQK